MSAKPSLAVRMASEVAGRVRQSRPRAASASHAARLDFQNGPVGDGVPPEQRGTVAEAGRDGAARRQARQPVRRLDVATGSSASGASRTIKVARRRA